MELEIKNALPFTLSPKLKTNINYKSDKIYTRSILGKLQNSEERNELNRGIFYVDR